MKIRSLNLLLCLAFFTSLSHAQWIDYSAEMNLKGMGSTAKELPFWMYHNQRGRISENTNIAGWITGKAIYHFNDRHTLDFSAGILYRDDFYDEIFIDELYAHYENPWFYATVGRKQQRELYNGLSATNYNILWSLNARPLPGIRVGTTEPVFFASDEGFGFEASWEDFFMGKHNFVEDANLHHKSFRLVYRSRYELEIKAGVEHFVQWGGTFPNQGETPATRGGYLEAVMLNYRTESDLVSHKNAPGNHIGSYVLEVGKTTDDYHFQFVYNYLFEDNRTSGFQNFPDGRYGIYTESTDKDRIINATMYEFFYTHHQNHDSRWPENYLNHYTYRSGWTYQNRILGAPFFSYDPEKTRVTNNKFTAHHIGIGGQFGDYFNTYPYRLLISYARNEGTYNNRFSRESDLFATYLDLRVLQSFVDLSIIAATEFSTLEAPKFGAGIHLRYEL